MDDPPTPLDTFVSAISQQPELLLCFEATAALPLSMPRQHHRQRIWNALVHHLPRSADQWRQLLWRLLLP
jgi:hypothetical protein